MRILFFGSDEFAIPSLAAVAASHHKIVGIVTQPDRPAGRGQHLTPCPVAIIAQEKKFPFFQPVKLNAEEICRQLGLLKPDCLVVVAYGQFIPKTLIEVAPFQAVNVHPSLLPKYRGAAPIQWALLSGDKTTGVTTMTVAEAMDAGDIYLQLETKIDETEDAFLLSQRLSKLGADLLIKTLEGIEKQSLKAKPQDPAKVILAPKLKKEQGHLNWGEAASHLNNRVRAFMPWPGTFCYWEEKSLKVWRTQISPERADAKPGTILSIDEGILVACGQGALRLLEVQLEGKKPMQALEFLHGHPLGVGTILK